MSRQVARGEACRAILSFAAPAHERSQQCRDEPKKCPSAATAWTLFPIRRPELPDESLGDEGGVRRRRETFPLGALPAQMAGNLVTVSSFL